MSRSWIRIALIALVGVRLAGCFPVPVPVPGGHDHDDDDHHHHHRDRDYR
jgi:hypothetical protein